MHLKYPQSVLITTILHWLLGNEQKAGDCSSFARGRLSEEAPALPAVINWLFITLQEIKQWPQKECASNSNSRREEMVLRAGKSADKVEENTTFYSPKCDINSCCSGQRCVHMARPRSVPHPQFISTKAAKGCLLCIITWSRFSALH